MKERGRERLGDQQFNFNFPLTPHQAADFVFSASFYELELNAICELGVRHLLLLVVCLIKKVKPG